MKVIVNAEYGSVFASASCAYYVPTKSPSWQTQSNASTEDCPEFARKQVLETPAPVGETVNFDSDELLDVPGAISFTGDQNQAQKTACEWALIEELVGPLRYREDVEDACMYRKSGTYRPRVPVRVVNRGLGAVAVYLSAHGHGALSIKNALALTYSEQCKHIYHDVYKHTNSFEWDGFDYD